MFLNIIDELRNRAHVFSVLHASHRHMACHSEKKRGFEFLRTTYKWWKWIGGRDIAADFEDGSMQHQDGGSPTRRCPRDERGALTETTMGGGEWIEDERNEEEDVEMEDNPRMQKSKNVRERWKHGRRNTTCYKVQKWAYLMLLVA